MLSFEQLLRLTANPSAGTDLVGGTGFHVRRWGHYPARSGQISIQIYSECRKRPAGRLIFIPVPNRPGRYYRRYEWLPWLFGDARTPDIIMGVGSPGDNFSFTRKLKYPDLVC